MNNMVLAAAYVVMALGGAQELPQSSLAELPAGDVRDQARQDCRDSAD